MGSTTSPVVEQSSQSGPVINGRPTLISIFSPAELRQSGFLASLQKIANEGFRKGHVAKNIMPEHILRVPDQKYLIDELGNAPNTFTYIVHENDEDVIATATMRPFAVLPIDELPDMTPEQIEKIRRNKSFTRSEGPPPDVQGWELKMMVVSIDAQRRGLAELLMRLCESEAKRRTAELPASEPIIKDVLFLLTCVEEINGPFYTKKGFREDYKTWQPIGTMESETGFTVLHMSKSIGTL